MDKQVAKARRMRLEDMNLYRKHHQQPHKGRDFDLSDPLAQRKDHPARVSDIDPLCGASTGQQFEGEDLGQKKRLGLQQEQMRIWTRVQMYEKERAQQEELNEKRLFIFNHRYIFCNMRWRLIWL